MGVTVYGTVICKREWGVFAQARACLYGAELLGKPSYSPCWDKKPICLYETELPGAKCFNVTTGHRRVTRLAEISVEFAEIPPRRVTPSAM